MTYNTYPEFEAALKQAWPESKAAIDKMMSYYEWYKLAKAQNKIVLGREKDLNQVINVYGRASVGGAMLIGVKNWDILVNDSWVMGGIHAQVPFFLKTILSFDTVYNEAQQRNPDPTRVLFVTTREVAGLSLFGYRMTDPADNDGQKFECDQPALAGNATFKAYRDHTKAVALAALS
jgi:hypothetical protein